MLAKLALLLVILVALMAVACGGQAPEPTPDIEATVEARVEAGLTARVATAIADLPSPTPRPVSTPTPLPTPPTSTPSPTPTAAADSEALRSTLDDLPDSTFVPYDGSMAERWWNDAMAKGRRLAAESVRDTEQCVFGEGQSCPTEAAAQAVEAFTFAIDISKKANRAYINSKLSRQVLFSELYSAWATAYYERYLAQISLTKLVARGKGVGWRVSERVLGDLNVAILMDENVPDYWYERGLAQSHTRNDLAISDFTSAIRLNPLDPRYYFERGRARQYQFFGLSIDGDALREERDRSRIQDYSIAIDLDPQLAKAFVERAYLYKELGNGSDEPRQLYESAIADLGSAIIGYTDNDEYNWRHVYDARHDYHDLFAKRGKLYMILAYQASQGGIVYGPTNSAAAIRAYSLAADDFTTYIDLLPQYDTREFLTFWHLESRGVAYMGIGEYELAVKDLTKYIDRYGDDKTYRLRGIAYSGLRLYDLAIRDYASGLRLYDLAIKDNAHITGSYTGSRDYIRYYILRGIAHKGLGDFESAIADFTSAIDINPQLATALWGRGAVFFELGEYELAANDLDAAIVRSKKHGMQSEAAMAEAETHLLAQPYALSVVAHIYLGDDPTLPDLREKRRMAVKLGYDANVLDQMIEEAKASR
jgi:tetratricopeptide (TPR) repeat protein